jgi:hypothetical protein
MWVFILKRFTISECLKDHQLVFFEQNIWFLKLYEKYGEDGSFDLTKLKNKRITKLQERRIICLSVTIHRQKFFNNQKTHVCVYIDKSDMTRR